MAKIFGCNKADIYRRTRAGEFDSFLVRIGVKGVRYDLQRVEEWLNQGGARRSKSRAAEDREYDIDEALTHDDDESSICFFPELLQLKCLDEFGETICESSLDALFASVEYDERRLSLNEKTPLISTLRTWADRLESLEIASD